mgnify:CR=1 FL=1
MLFIVVTCDVTHAPIGALNRGMSLNSSDISVIALVNVQSFISSLPAAPHSSTAQHTCPVLSTVKQLVIAVTKSALDANGAAETVVTVKKSMNQLRIMWYRVGDIYSTFIFFLNLILYSFRDSLTYFFAMYLFNNSLKL